jgi:nitrite reductase/ring-hydroxylating ferredoxin subunit
VAAGELLICGSDDLREAGRGFRFSLSVNGRQEPAFAIRFGGRAFAYLNRCAHTPIELDWNAGEFFDAEGRWLICATHGALYDPETGRCVGGRCGGRGLIPVAIIEREGLVYVVEQG